MIGAGQAPFFEQADNGGMIAYAATIVPEFVAIEIAADNGRRTVKPPSIGSERLVQLADVAAAMAASHGHGPNRDEEKLGGAT